MNLLVVSLTALSAAGQPSFEPGQSLQALIEPESQQVSVSGGMPMARSAAMAPNQPGSHWLAMWPDGNDQPTLIRFSVVGAAQPAMVHETELSIDTQPPTAVLHWQRNGETVAAATLGPNLSPSLIAQDRSGVRAASLRIDGSTLSEPNWHSGIDSGPHQFSAVVSDVLGNQSVIDLGSMEVDLDSPEMTYAALDAVNGWVGKPPYRISAKATDRSAVSLRVISAGETVCTGNETLDCSVKRAEFELVAVDAVGNRSAERIELKRDRVGPKIESDPPPESGKVRLRIGQTAEIRALDPSGVAHACIRHSYGRCIDLPHSFIAKKRGRYKFFVEVRDEFGNADRHRVKIEVKR